VCFNDVDLEMTMCPVGANNGNMGLLHHGLLDNGNMRLLHRLLNDDSRWMTHGVLTADELRA